MNLLSLGAFLSFWLAGWTAQRVHARTCQEDCESSYLAQIWQHSVLQNYCRSSCRHRTSAPTTQQPYSTPRSTTPRPNDRKWNRRGQPTLVGGRCGVQPPRDRVAGGTKARPCEYPWVVAVNVTDKFCGGSILDGRHILTAAHCVKSLHGQLLTTGDIVVHIGSSKLADMVAYKVRNIQAHPNHYAVTKDYDVAVLTLQNPISEFCASAICLPDGIPDVSERDTCFVAGWGTFTYTSNHVSSDLMAARVPLVNQNTCAQSYNSLQPYYINDLKLCAGDFANGGLDACRGDSGGPYMCNRGGVWYQFGIVSFGRGCARPYYPGVYTRVANAQILDFIHRALRY